MNPTNPFFILVFYLLIRTTTCYVNPNYQACEPQTCGNGPTITYPFYIQGKQDSFCGFTLFGLVCASNGFPMLNLPNTFYIVNEILYHNHSLRVSNPSFPISNSINCVSPSSNLTLGDTFILAPNQKEVLLFSDCDLPSLPEEMKENVVGCYEGNRTRSVLGMTVDDEEKLQYGKDNCMGREISTVVKNVEGGMREALGRGFLLKSSNWTASECDVCESSGGRCGFVNAYGFRCFCRDRDHFKRCHPVGKGSRKSVVIAATVSAAIIVGVFVPIIYWFRRMLLWKNKSKGQQDFEATLKSHGSFATKRYSYLEIKKMTNCFKEKLGQGGYGRVQGEVT